VDIDDDSLAQARQKVQKAGMGERIEDRAPGDLVEGDPLGALGIHLGRLGDVPGDRLAFTIEVGGQVDGVGPLRCLGDLVDLLAAVVRHDVLGGEVVVDVDAELALAGILRKVAHVSV